MRATKRSTSGTVPTGGGETRPIYVIGGFLGSGKTTLLLRMLAQVRAEGGMPAVIMNEYGERSVDGRLLEHGHEAGIALEELVSGCVCCDLADGLTEKVISLLRSTTGPIFVETTGLALVGQVATAVERALDDGRGSGRARLESIVVAVDGTRFGDIETLWKHAAPDLAAADTLVITKCDRAEPKVVERLKATLKRRHARARVLASSNGDLDPRLLLGSAAPRPRMPRPRRSVANSAAGFASVTCKILGSVNAETLGPVLGSFAPALARVKGFVRTTGSPGMHALQWVPGALELTPHRRARVSPHLVVIGKDLDWEKFVDALDTVIEEPRKRASGANA
jgi:G3E family GTPase